jgi:hypothetical protein
MGRAKAACHRNATGFSFWRQETVMPIVRAAALAYRFCKPHSGNNEKAAKTADGPEERTQPIKELSAQAGRALLRMIARSMGT